MAEVKELVESFRRCGSIEEILALVTMMQGQLDMNSFIAGLLFGKGGGRGFDRTAALLLAVSSSGNMGQQQATGGITNTTNSMQQILPLLLLLGREEWEEHGDKTIVLEKKIVK